MTKITLAGARAIALDRLVACDGNVRRIQAGVSIEELADDIARRGLLQSLSVRPILGEDGEESGKFAVSAGGPQTRGVKALGEAETARPKRARSLHREDGGN